MNSPVDNSIRNLLTFDVEDYYHIFCRNFFKRAVEPSEEVVECTSTILNTLERYGVKATFFVVGRVAETFPHLVKKIHRAGHEIASHSHDHIFTNRIGPQGFRADLQLSRDILEQVTGEQVMGFRAPEFSIDKNTEWAFEILAELGFKYDSSIFPIKAKRYGVRSAPQVPYTVKTKKGKVVEIPLSSVSFFGVRIPAVGGGYLRHYPLVYTAWALRQINRNGRRAVVYMHPHEFALNPKPMEFRVDGFGARMRIAYFRHMQLHNRKRSVEKLNWLLTNYRFTSICEVFNSLKKLP